MENTEIMCCMCWCVLGLARCICWVRAGCMHVSGACVLEVLSGAGAWDACNVLHALHVPD